MLGVQKPIHLRNRVAVDDMIQNGVKPWIVSKEDEQTHLTSLNSLRLFQGFAQPLIINGQRERIVMDQIQQALKVTIDRISRDINLKNRAHGGVSDESYMSDEYSDQEGDQKPNTKRERSQKGKGKKE